MSQDANQKKIGSKTSGKKTQIIINPDEDSVLVKDTVKEGVASSTEINERVVSVAERRKRSILMRRLKPRLMRARKIASRRFAKKEMLEKRSRRAARKIIRGRYLGQKGLGYGKATTAEKISMDRIIDKKATPKTIKRLVTRLMPSIRKAEGVRLRRAQMRKVTEELANIAKNEMISESALTKLYEKAESANVPYTLIESVFLRGFVESEDPSRREQTGFNRVNSFLAGGKAFELDRDLFEEYGAGFEGTPELLAKYKKDTPGQTPQEKLKNTLSRTGKRNGR